MKKFLCWIQLLSIIALVLMVPCTHCSDGFTGTRTTTSIGSFCHGESEDHHNCTSIHCSCHGIFCPIPITSLSLDHPTAESFGDLPTSWTKAEPLTDIFQPPRTSIG
ncbi:MAG TPA: hypothetical protein VIV61_11705 [Candidatus Ozemobacteraceae bacterium]